MVIRRYKFTYFTISILVLVFFFIPTSIACTAFMMSDRDKVLVGNNEYIYTSTEVETSIGKIVVGDVAGNINSETSNDAIEIEGVKGLVTAITSNGAIDVEVVDGVIELETSNGAIEAEIPAIGDNGLRVRTNNGTIELHLAADLDVDIDAKTSNNDIEFDGIEVIASDISRNRFRGRIGNGGKKLTIKTYLSLNPLSPRMKLKGYTTLRSYQNRLMGMSGLFILVSTTPVHALVSMFHLLVR